MRMNVNFGLRLDERQGPSSHDYFMAPVVGRQGFLGLLETYLGLSGPETPHAERVAAYLGFLSQAEVDGKRRFYSKSLEADSVGSAARLLEWRDEWYLGGWDGTALPNSPRKLQDLAAVETLAAGELAPGEGERLVAVANALRAGNRIPVASVQLVDDLNLFPAAWQAVLALMEVRPAPELTPAAPGDLGRLQKHVLAAVDAGRAGDKLVLEGDGSVEVVQARSCEMAEHWLSAICRAKPADRLILCEDGGDALDATLMATGVPACGFGASSDLRPALQAMGLALETCWTPIGVPRLVEFLVHPIGPFTAKARRPLARALAAQPGIGSESWVATKESLKELENAKEVLGDVAFWFEGERWDRGAGAPIATLGARADRVYQELKRLAGAADADKLGVGPAIHQCKAVLASLEEFQRQGVATLTPREIEQLLSQATPSGAINPYADSQAGCLKSAVVAAVCSPEEADEVFWWMPSTPVLPAPHPWSAQELAGLAAAGVRLRDPAAELVALSRQWLRPLFAARYRFVLVLPPPGQEEHPAWQLIKQIVPVVKVVSIDEALPDAHTKDELAGAVKAVELFTAERYIELGIPLESRREKHAFTNLNDFFHNPALAVLKDVATLRTGTVLEASDGSRLRGTLAHRVVEKLFQQDGALTWTSEQALAWFDAMIDPLLEAEAAPLLVLGASVELHRFKRMCRRAACVLLAHLQKAGVTKVQTELELEGTFAGEPFTAKMDMLAHLPNGQTALLDLKLSWASGYRKILAEGRHLQLALYAGVVRENLGALPATVGYFIFESADLLVTQGNIFSTAEVRAPAASLLELLEMAVATWKWRQGQWAEGKVEWVDGRFGKLKTLGGPEGTLPLEEVGRYDSDHLALLGGWE
ncbi:PD-(D/E)XK nuclease family protein [Polaromonas sp. SM01]|uniref:PD-(D/E)XK nuclease family protein n=1 Tax=Polaromonas sp. SM01 TaxID=3085630 RepID=UPI0029827DF3|nr:PD-(D/E)XK nuclease family protein [Polaromonas sp. SM01]MDW5443812.1 hypothetical protein [Polaromonas sp. SM01]